MKKKILVVLLLVIIGILTGCHQEEERNVLTCSKKETDTDGVKMELSYKITYKGDYVEMIEAEEKVISDDDSILESYKTSIESAYSPYKDVEYYNYSVEVLDNTLTSKTEVDYSKIDTDKLIEIDSNNASLITNGKIKLDDIKTIYELIGATCE